MIGASRIVNPGPAGSKGTCAFITMNETIRIELL